MTAVKGQPCELVQLPPYLVALNLRSDQSMVIGRNTIFRTNP